MKVIAFVVLLAAIFAIAKAVWHAFGMIRGIRPSAQWWVNMVPFVAFALPEALDSGGQEHRFKFVASAIIAVLLAVGAVLLRAAEG
jgi:hypothetical protein